MNLSDSRTTGALPIVRMSAAEAVFSSLRRVIESGELPVGAKLGSEAVLSAQYAVSRSVIREALRSCAALGLTQTRSGKGTFVLSARTSSDLVLGSFSARSLMEARPHIEVPAAQLAATRASAGQRKELTDIVEAMETEDDHEAWVGLDAAFHAGIARASRNEVFEQVVNDIREAMVNQSETINLITGRQNPSQAEHRAILAAIEAGDGAAAGRAMARHLEAVDEALTLILGAEKA
ncbi:MAG: FCD domain-containing protein [Micrococcaceae bacterium]|nr:FCD domain-containing protein [Micrococcaceae bacterium]